MHPRFAVTAGALAAAWLAGGALGCDARKPPASPPAGTEPVARTAAGGSRPHVVLLVAGRCPADVSPPAATPWLGAWRSPRHYTASTASPAALDTLLTGLPPRSAAQAAQAWPQLFGSQGWSTLAVLDGRARARITATAFDSVHLPGRDAGPETRMAPLLEALRSAGPPVAAWVEVEDCTGERGLPASLQWLGDELSHERGEPGRDSVLSFTALAGFGSRLDEDAIRVPWWIGGLGVSARRAGLPDLARIGTLAAPGPALTRAQDVLPTLLATAGAGLPQGLGGVDVGHASPGFAIVEDVDGAALVEPPLKLVKRGETVSLHDLAAATSGEPAVVRPADTARLLRTLLHALGVAPGAPPEASIDEETLEELRSLGYIR